MRFYKNQHQFYIGIDLHARTMYICVINNIGETVFHKNMECSRDNLELVTNTFGKDIVVGVECIFTWYWVADFCAENGIDFALGHAYYMKSIHGGKTKSDKIDSEKIANLLRGGMFPIAYAYPKEKRAVRDLLRRRLFFVRQRAELSVHLQNTNHQYNIKVDDPPKIAGRYTLLCCFSYLPPLFPHTRSRKCRRRSANCNPYTHANQYVHDRTALFLCLFVL